MTQYLSADKEKELVQTANLLVAKGKGLLAADESTGIEKRHPKIVFYSITIVV